MIDILKKNNFWSNDLPSEEFKRTDYLSQFVANIGTSLIKVIIGQRRSGKSFLLRSLIRYLIMEKNVPKENIIYINKDLYDFESVKNIHDLDMVIQEYRLHFKPEGKVFLFIDEVQEIEQWEKYLNSLSQDHVFECEVFVTGSNAHLLSSELATYLSGRTVVLPVYPFSYKEFLGITKKDQLKSTYIEYLKMGGLPEIFHFNSTDMVRNYMESLKDSIVLRDIVHRHQVREVDLLRKLVDFITDSVGSQFSARSVQSALKTLGYISNIETVGNYLQFLCDAWYIHRAPRFDIRGKKILQGEGKYYLNDLGFKYHLNSRFDLGIGRYLENAVYLQFKRAGYDLYSGKLDNREIDLVAEKNDKRWYVQVAYILTDEEVISREFGNLEMIKDNYPKMVVSLDDISIGNRSGIEHVLAWELEP